MANRSRRRGFLLFRGRHTDGGQSHCLLLRREMSKGRLFGGCRDHNSEPARADLRRDRGGKEVGMTLRTWLPRLLLLAVAALIVLGTAACGGGNY